MAYAAGVDVGSTQTKAVIIDEQRKIVATFAEGGQFDTGDADAVEEIQPKAFPDGFLGEIAGGLGVTGQPHQRGVGRGARVHAGSGE